MADALKDKGVSSKHEDYINFANKWKRCRDVVAGRDEVHKAGVAYLPKLSEQTDAEYNAYKTRAGFYNATWRSIAGFKGMLFNKPPVKEMPKTVEDFSENINLAGLSLDRQAEGIACELLEVGRIGLLVDFPKPPDNASGKVVTKADVEKMGLRPSIQIYFAENIINWKYITVKNKTMLGMVVLVEKVEEKTDNEFETKLKTQYRVLDLTTDAYIYRVRLFEKNEKGEDVLIGAPIFPFMNGKVMQEIPFVFINTDNTNGAVDDPPLIDLVDKNLDHYRVSADYEHGCHFVALPTPWVAGYTQTGDGAKSLHIGSTVAWLFESPEAKAGYLEFTGAGLKTLKDNLDGKKQEMATLGARMLADASDKQVETFGATAIKHSGENSILANIAINASIGIETALKIFAAWCGQADAKIKYEINRKFVPFPMDAPTLTALIGAWQSGAISFSDLFAKLKEGDIIAAEKTIDEHQAEIDNQSLPMPTEQTTKPGKTKEDKTSEDTGE